MLIPEPEINKGEHPEASLQKAIVAEIQNIFAVENIKYILLENFGFDIGVFIQNSGKNYTRFIEIKTFVGSRIGGVGFGNSKGEGPQVDLLLNSESDLAIVDSDILWLLGIGTRTKGSPRFALFNSTQAKNAAMGIVQREKQNNLRINSFQDKLFTWEKAINAIRQFLLKP